MMKKKSFYKKADVLKVRNIIPLGVKLTHDRSLYLQVWMKEAGKQEAKQSFEIQTKRKKKTISPHKLGFCI